MNHTCIKRFYGFIFCILIPTNGFSQFDSIRKEGTFLQHLRIQKLYNERLFVLNQFPEGNDTDLLLIEKAWTYTILARYDSALSGYRRASVDSIRFYGFTANYYSLLFRFSKFKRLDSLMTNPPDDESLMKFRTAVDLVNLTYDIRSLPQQLPERVKSQYEKYWRIEKKSGALATFYSLVIPGSGKLYYHQKHQALNMFLANLALGLQAYESYNKAGPQSARFIIFGGLFSVFYISNLYGTAVGLKKAKRDNKKQLQYELVNGFLPDAGMYPGRY